MSRLPLTLLAACVLLGACRTETAPPKPKAQAAVRAKGSPTPRASATPAAVPLPRAPGPYALLRGGVKLEARYLVDLGLAAPAGDAVALTGTGRLLSDLGGGIIAERASGLITDNGAGLLADKGGALVSDQGGGLITDNGAGIVSNNSGGLITDNGAGVVGQNGASLATRALQAAALGLPRFRLAEASPAIAAIPPGELRPVAGAVVLPIDLRTGRPVGTVVRSDAAGGFAVEVPQAMVGNVLFAVRVPAADRDSPAFTDPRLRPNLLAAIAGEASARMADEDQAAVTRYLQACFVTRLDGVLGADSADEVAERLAGARFVVPALKAVLLPMIAELREVARASGADKAPPARRLALARLMAHRLLARMDLAGVQIDPTFAPRYPGPPEPAHAAMVDIMRRMREAASARLQADPRAFDAKPYLAGSGFQVRRGADLPDFCVQTYLIPDDPQGLEKNGVVLADLGFEIETGGADQKARLGAAMYSMVGALAQALLLDAEAKADVFGVVRDFKPS